MECQKCGTWNPDDKVKCWRCSEELPLPPKPRQSRKISSQTWLWIAAILFSLVTFLAQCGLLGGDGDRGGGINLAPLDGVPIVRLVPHVLEVGRAAFYAIEPVLVLDAWLLF